jgi:hypothetical protein
VTTSLLPDEQDDIEVPTIDPADYLADKHLRDIYLYLTQGLLTNNDKADRITLLLAEDFFVDEKGILYRISLPRGKKASRVQSTEIRLAIPEKYLAEIVERCHQIGHLSKEKNFQFLRARFYAKNLWDAVVRYQKTCDRCLRFKKDYAHRTDPLHSLSVPNQPAMVFSTDHIVLSRPTSNNERAIVIFIDQFSKWPAIKLVKDTSALEAAKAFVEKVVSVFGLHPNFTLHSDKGSAYTSNFFRSICSLLNVRLITSASQISQSNGQAESCVKSVKQMLRMFADSDLHLDAAIPLIELSLRSQPHSATGLTPAEIILGRKICLPIIGNEHINNAFKGNQAEYYNFIRARLSEIHQGVAQNLHETKERDASQYNSRHNVQEPQWKIGDEVLITNRRVKKNAESILTRPLYHGSFYIVDIIENPGFGKSYKLVRTSDGSALRNLISGSRLRLYTAPEREIFHAKYPKLQSKKQASTAPQGVASNSNSAHTQPDCNAEPQSSTQLPNEVKTAPANTDSSVLLSPSRQNETNRPNQVSKPAQKYPFEPALRILKERKTNGRTEYLVLFETQQKAWADKVSPALLRAFRIYQEQLRRKRRKRTLKRR